MTKLPTISIIIPTYNEEFNIKRCLDSIFKQNYPKKLLEVIVVDNYSEDKTIEITQKYPVIILMNKIKNTQVSKMVGLRKAKGDTFYYMDADLEFKSKDFLKRLAACLMDNPLIIGSFGKMCHIPNDNSLNRFLTYDVHQRDPLLEYFSPSIYSTVIKREQEYFLCQYRLDKIPPEGRCLFWKKKIMKTSIAKGKEFKDLDSLVTLVKNGFCYFAYVPKAEEYHWHVQGIKSLIKKRLRNIRRNFIPNYKTREYTWFNLDTKKDLLKIIFWIFYAHLILPAFIRGCIKAIRYKDYYCILYEPFLSLLLTDLTLYGFMSNTGGLQFIRSYLFGISRNKNCFAKKVKLVF